MGCAMPGKPELLNRSIERALQEKRTARGVVVAPQPLAVEVGAGILRAGGNAIDAAIATALAQGVVDPFMGGVGGFGCLCAYSADRGRVATVNFHGRAGSRARPDIFAEDVLGQVHGHGERYDVRGSVNQIGHRSVVVPGTPAGFALTHRLFGRLPWRILFDPAIHLARNGVPLPGEVYDRWVEDPEPGHRNGWDRIHATSACAAIFAPDGKLLRPGALLRQLDYASVLERLATAGAEDFYRGDLAATIVEDFQRNSGLFTADDLANYAAEEMDPVSAKYRDVHVYSVPLPASGVQLVQMLKVLEHISVGALRRCDNAQYIHYVARTMLSSFADRARHLGDPRFTSPPVERLISDEYADELAELVCGADPISVPGLAYLEPKTTTNVCVIDQEGNAIALTHTLGSGSGVVVPGLGFVFNNCMYQYNPIPGHPNSIAPGKARLTGVTPTLLMRDAAPWAAIGGLGGTRILTAVLHSILNLVDHGMTPVEAVEAPRFHAEGPWLEMESRISHGTSAALRERGWNLRPSPKGYDRAFAIAQIAQREGDQLRGGSDPRGGGGIAIA